MSKTSGTAVTKKKNSNEMTRVLAENKYLRKQNKHLRKHLDGAFQCNDYNMQQSRIHATHCNQLYGMLKLQDPEAAKAWLENANMELFTSQLNNFPFFAPEEELGQDA